MTTCVLKDLIDVSRDGEWGQGEPFDDSVEMLAIRGTDFEDARFGVLDTIPRRHVAKRIAERKMLQPWDLLIEAAGGTKEKILVEPFSFVRSCFARTSNHLREL
jgi:type I restriction enzyme S subunit